MENGVENTARIIMTPRIPYDTDISEQQWQLLKPHLPEAKTGGRKRTTNLREVISLFNSEVHQNLKSIHRILQKEFDSQDIF